MSSRTRLLPLTIAAMIFVLAFRSVTVLRELCPGLTIAFAPMVTNAHAETISRAAPMQPPSAQVAENCAPGSTPLGTPPVSESERSILTALRHRREQLDAREAQLTSRENLIAASGQRLTARLDELLALQSKLQGLEEARRQRDESNWTGLVKLYESMKPSEAAGIFDGLDMAVLAPVVDRMKESKAAAIMAAMDPVKARNLTIVIAQARLKSNGLGPENSANRGGS